jgi:hypothetical protein
VSSPSDLLGVFVGVLRAHRHGVDHHEIPVGQLDSDDFQWNVMLVWAEEQEEILLICLGISPV